jgi:Flp pilus assembly secretin CpaC
MATTLPSTQPPPLPSVPLPPQISASQSREADDAYLDGAKQVQHKNLAAAIQDFERAVRLNPNNRDYTLALLATRENRITELVQSAARARKHGDKARADALLAQARAIDPDNRVVAQHFDNGSYPDPNDNVLGNLHAANIASTLAGPIEFEPLDGTKSIHLQGDAQTVIRGVYRTFGIDVTFDTSYTSQQPLQFDLDKATYADATRVLGMMAHCFAVPVQPKVALIAKDTQENRDELSPLVEETVYLPGLSQDQMTELANLARNVFDVKQVTASATGGYILLRGDEQVLQQVNATYADMLDGGSEVLFDIDLYEMDASKTRNIGATLPSSAGIFSVAAEAQSLVSTNQSLINQAVSAGLLTLNGSYIQNLIKELEFLVAAGTVTATQYTELLGTFGNGLTFAGLFLGSSSSFALALNSTDSRMLDAVTIRSSNHQAVNFRAGTRYPVVTAIYSTPSLSGLAATAAAAGISAATIAQYGGAAASASVPQFQFEDLGITLKMTPQIQHNSEVSLTLDMKIEALAGGTINSIPILNNRALTSTITVPAGHTALLATLLNTNEIKSLDGLPGLSELPGFQGTDQDVEKDSTELLITITPHIVRTGAMRVTSKRLAAIRTGNSSGFSQ